MNELTRLKLRVEHQSKVVASLPNDKVARAALRRYEAQLEQEKSRDKDRDGAIGMCMALGIE